MKYKRQSKQNGDGKSSDDSSSRADDESDNDDEHSECSDDERDHCTDDLMTRKEIKKKKKCETRRCVPVAAADSTTNDYTDTTSMTSLIDDGATFFNQSNSRADDVPSNNAADHI